NLAAGADATLTLTLTVGASAAAGANVTSNTAAESAVVEGDTNASNNSDTKSTSVTTQADLSVSKTGAASIPTDSDLTYTITLTNNGPSDAQTVSLSDPLPAGTTFVSETHPGGFLAVRPPRGTNDTGRVAQWD